MASNEYIINGINTYGIGSTKVQIAEGGLSLTTISDNFSMNGLGFLYNGSGATWNDVRKKVDDLKATVTPPNASTLTVNNTIQVTNGINTATITPTTMTATTFTGSLNGTANFATTTVVASDSSTITYPTFVLGTSGNQGQKINTNLTYNAFTNTLNVTNLNGNALTATTATTATNATNSTNATNAVNVYNSGLTTAGNYGVAYMTNTVGNTFIASDTVGSHLTFNPSTNTLTTRFLILNGVTNAISAPNATSISLPNANVTATTFTGALAGNATTATVATNSTITADNTGSTFYPTFVSNTGTQGLKIDTGMSYVPSTDTLTVANITGNCATATNATNATNATLASTATVATNSTITADNTSSSTFYPTFVSNTGTQGLKIDTSMNYVPLTDTLTVTNVAGNCATANSATSAFNLNALNPITPYYTYPVSSPSNIGWTQVITTTGWTFNNVTKAYACNTTPLVAGIYIMRAYVYCGNSSFYSGYQLINLVASNSAITNNSTTGWLDPSNASPMGYMYSRIGAVAGDSVNNAPFVVNNTGAGFYPYWAIAVNNSVQISPAGNGVPQMNFCRIA
jgi:hypothetical protein